jgi:queuine/archaeosine tRNA-ribosyltransferase
MLVEIKKYNLFCFLSGMVESMNRSRAYIRYQRKSHINRKKRIIKSQGNYWYYRHDGVLSKGKIHCSCPMCRHKSYDRASIKDTKTAVKQIEQLQDYNVKLGEVNHIRNRTKVSNKRYLK